MVNRGRPDGVGAVRLLQALDPEHANTNQPRAERLGEVSDCTDGPLVEK
jgi:hypothetical protein